jgi:hypothetical protein
VRINLDGTPRVNGDAHQQNTTPQSNTSNMHSQGEFPKWNSAASVLSGAQRSNVTDQRDVDSAERPGVAESTAQVVWRMASGGRRSTARPQLQTVCSSFKRS